MYRYFHTAKVRSNLPLIPVNTGLEFIMPLCSRILLLITVVLSAPSQADGDVRVKIAPDLESVEVIHAGKPFTIRRRQDPDSIVNPIYAKTARDCPPFCIQPMRIAPGVDTIGELELLEYLQLAAQDGADVLVIDSRTTEWLKDGTIPGSINIPWTQLSPSAGADPFAIAEIFENRFGAINQEGLWNYANAKTLVLFCNGLWCGQSPSNIKTLLNFGYPAHKLKWYRGGMQAWENLGLSVVR